MARKHVVTTLERHFARLAGRGASADMAHVEAVIRMFEPDWDGASVKPIRPRGASRWNYKGHGTRAAFAALRNAQAPLSATEIARAAYLECGMEPPGNDELRLVGTDLVYSLRRHCGAALVASGTRPVRYRLIER